MGRQRGPQTGLRWTRGYTVRFRSHCEGRVEDVTQIVAVLQANRQPKLDDHRRPLWRM